MFYTELNGDFLKRIVLKEDHRGVHFFWFLATDFRIMRILHRDARRFFEVDCVEESYTEAFHFFGF